MRYFLMVCLCSLWVMVLNGQQFSLMVCDQLSKEVVGDAHVFFVNTTYGTVTDKRGTFQLTIPEELKEDLIVSHVSFETKLITSDEYGSYEKGDTIFLAPNSIDPNSVVVRAKRSRKWKKQYKKFKVAFLGRGEAAKQCEILNPEVLRFEENERGLVVTAIDLINIKNDYLGYDINYLLNEAVIDEDGSSAYFGRSIFTEMTEVSEKVIEHRSKEHDTGLRHFLKSLINDRLEQDEYGIQISYIDKDGEEILKRINRTDLLFKDSKTGLYHLRFNEFLKVTNRRVKEIGYERTGLRIGGLESARFSGSVNSFSENIGFTRSYLYKIAQTLVFDDNGHVTNSTKMKEYGYWAEQKVARTLPYDYNIDFKEVMETEMKGSPMEHKDELDQSGWEAFYKLVNGRQSEIDEQLTIIKDHWEESMVPPMIELLRVVRERVLLRKVVKLLEERTGQKFGTSYYGWSEWLWQSDPQYDENYAPLKGIFYQGIDEKFSNYFDGDISNATIRLDEVMWGGVKQDGIPPLRKPKLVGAVLANYLDDEDVVFGLNVNGIAKAYPKRILGWHEMFVDDFGDTEIAGVYCTLCGTVIAYDTDVNGTRHELGTSGFLYRSNKLMYDKATQSLWNTIEGEPVIGPLVGQGIGLNTYPVVTTTWGAWKQAHPYTEVLSLDTGHDRNYDEGVAYQQYYSSDELMFPVPKSDDRLYNKDEVFIIRSKDYKIDPLAIDVDWINKKGWTEVQIGSERFVVLSDDAGAISAYSAGDVKFKKYKNGALIDNSKVAWEISDEMLKSEAGITLSRTPAHRIFWFAWVNTYPDTRLLK